MNSNELQRQEAQVPERVERTRNQTCYTPRADIYETADAMVVVANMPGIDDKHVDITLEKNVLTIDGRVEPRTYPGYTLNYNEFEQGDYHRAFTLSSEVDRDKISATVKDGVLRLVLPKAATAKARKIAVSVG